MHRASAIIAATRLEKELSLEEMSKRTKIPIKYLQAIESENVQGFPDEPYCSMIVKDYADSLGLNGPNILRLFCRDISAQKRSHSTFSKPLSFTPQSAVGLISVLSAVIFFGYLVLEYFKFSQPPHLDVNWPDKAVDSVLEISGRTDSEATVRINEMLIIVDADGRFRHELDVGATNVQIIVQAQSRNGKSTVDQKVY